MRAARDGEGDAAAELPPLDAREEPATRERDRIRRRNLDQIPRDSSIAGTRGDGSSIVDLELAQDQSLGDERRRARGQVGGRVPLNSWNERHPWIDAQSGFVGVVVAIE